MKTIEVYKDSSGNLHEDYDKAMMAQADIIGEALDNLIGDIDDTRITKTDRHRVIINTMKSKLFKAKVTALYDAVESENWQGMLDYLTRQRWFKTNT